MTIDILNTTDPNSKILKNTTGVYSAVSCTLKEDCSLMDPVVLLDFTGHENVLTANYARLYKEDDASIGKYYHIRDVKILSNNLVEISMHVDVLMTYASGLLNCPCIAAKNQSRFNLYLNDPGYKCSQQDYVLINEFPDGFHMSASHYVMTIFGDKKPLE